MFKLNGLQKALDDCTRNFNRMGFALEDIQALALKPFQNEADLVKTMKEIYDLAHAACPERGPEYDRATALV